MVAAGDLKWDRGLVEAGNMRCLRNGGDWRDGKSDLPFKGKFEWLWVLVKLEGEIKKFVLRCSAWDESFRLLSYFWTLMEAKDPIPTEEEEKMVQIPQNFFSLVPSILPRII